MFKRIIAFVVAWAMLVTPLVSRADGLGNVLDNLASGAVANVNSPGRLSSQARTSMVLGGFDMRVPQTANTPTLISFTPPSFDAGCSGVSMFFGGFSFISGKEFEQLLKTIASGVALGFVAHLALKTLCPQCEAVVQLMQRLNQIASMAAKDACKFGKALADAYLGSNQLNASQGSEGKVASCADVAANKGLSSDYLGSLDDTLCKTINAMNGVLNQDINDKLQALKAAGASDAEIQKAKLEAQLKTEQGNRIWIIAGAFFDADDPNSIKNKTMVMNILGTTIKPTDAVPFPLCSGMPAALNEKQEVTCKPTFTPQEMLELYMCGVQQNPPVATTPSVQAACDQTVGFKAAQDNNKQMWECDFGQEQDCMFMVAHTLAQSTTLSGYVGLNQQVSNLLQTAVQRVVQNQPLWNGDSSDLTGQKIVGLIQAAPYPIYQAINAAAVYPAAASDILDSLTVLIAEQMAISFFNEFFRTAGRTSKGTDLTPEVLENFSKAMGGFSDHVEQLHTKTVNNIALQEGITQSIRSLNLAIQRQVMTEEVFGSNEFGKGLTNLVSNRSTPTNAGTSN